MSDKDFLEVQAFVNWLVKIIEAIKAFFSSLGTNA